MMIGRVGVAVLIGAAATATAAFTQQKLPPLKKFQSAFPAAPKKAVEAAAEAAAGAAGQVAPFTFGPADAIVQRIAEIQNFGDLVIYTPYPSPLVLVGKRVINTTDGKEVGSVPAYDATSSVRRALSPDGKCFAQARRNGQRYSIEVLDTASGERKHQLDFSDGNGQDVEHLAFTSQNHLVAVVQARRSTHKLCLWRMSDGKLLREMQTPRLNSSKYAFSPDGRRLATLLNGVPTIIDFAKGKLGQPLQTPNPASGLITFFRSSGMAFSPDGNELAAIFSNEEGDNYLIIWHLDGKVVEFQNLGHTIGHWSALDSGVVWAPDGQGLMLQGKHFFERSLKRVVCILQLQSPSYPCRFLNNDRILVAYDQGVKRQLVAAKLPRERISKSIAALKSGGPNVLKPGDRVNLNVEVGATFSPGAEILKEVHKIVADRLTCEGLKVATDGPVIVTVRYSEAKGEQAAVIASRFPIGPRRDAVDTGQRITLTTVRVEVEMKAGEKTLFELKHSSESPHTVDARTVTDETVRRQVKEIAYSALYGMPLPYFVAVDDSCDRLPILMAVKE